MASVGVVLWGFVEVMALDWTLQIPFVKFVLQCLRLMTLCGLEGDKENLGGNAIVKFEH